jgi:hypothetical protein
MKSLVPFIWSGALFIAALLTILCTIGLFFGLMYRFKLTWMVQPAKWVTLFSSWAILASVFGIIGTFRHAGGGMVSKNEGGSMTRDGYESYGEYDEWVDEAEYKYHHWLNYGLILVFGLFFYVGAQFVEHAEQQKERDAQMQDEFEIARCHHAHAKAATMQSALEFRIWRNAWKLAKRNSDFSWMGTESQKARWAEGETS